MTAKWSLAGPLGTLPGRAAKCCGSMTRVSDFSRAEPNYPRPGLKFLTTNLLQFWQLFADNKLRPGPNLVMA
jgi:hypothetical protein